MSNATIENAVQHALEHQFEAMMNPLRDMVFPHLLVKYPEFAASEKPTIVEVLVKAHCFVADKVRSDYQVEVEVVTNPLIAGEMPPHFTTQFAVNPDWFGSSFIAPLVESLNVIPDLNLGAQLYTDYHTATNFIIGTLYLQISEAALTFGYDKNFQITVARVFKQEPPQ